MYVRTVSSFEEDLTLPLPKIFSIKFQSNCQDFNFSDVLFIVSCSRNEISKLSKH